MRKDESRFKKNNKIPFFKKNIAQQNNYNIGKSESHFRNPN